MTNRVAQANDALWGVVEMVFAAHAPERNPTKVEAPKARAPGATAAYVAFHDDKTPQMLRAMCGPIYDLKLSPRVILVFLGAEADRRAAATAALESLKAALAADVTLGGAVEDARPEATEDAEAAGLAWMAGGLIAPIRLLFNAPTEAG